MTYLEQLLDDTYTLSDLADTEIGEHILEECGIPFNDYLEKVEKLIIKVEELNRIMNMINKEQ